MLTMLLRVTMPSGKQRIIKALVDTGAQVNLIQKGLLDEEEFSAAETPLNLIAANGQVLEGGKKVVKLEIKMHQKSEEELLPPEVQFDGQFFEAAIGINAILSYPWCRKISWLLFHI